MRTFDAPERHDPLNDDLDRIEDAIADLIARGGEAPLRARLFRLLGGTDQQRAEHVFDASKALGSGLSVCGDSQHQAGCDLAPAVRMFAALYAKGGNGARAFADAFPDTVADATRRSERARVLLRRPAVAALVKALGGDPTPKTNSSRRRDEARDVVDVEGADLERISRIIGAAAGVLPLRVTVEICPATPDRKEGRRGSA